MWSNMVKKQAGRGCGHRSASVITSQQVSNNWVCSVLMTESVSDSVVDEVTAVHSSQHSKCPWQMLITLSEHKQGPSEGNRASPLKPSTTSHSGCSQAKHLCTLKRDMHMCCTARRKHCSKVPPANLMRHNIRHAGQPKTQ